jgi:GxxExxY protein
MNHSTALVQQELTGQIRQTAFEVHRYFGNGFLEKVYANALAHRLRKKGLPVCPKVKVKVHDEDGTIVGDYEADLLVKECVLVEVKAVKKLAPEHTAQVLNYLKATGIEVGLLINFGSYRFEMRRFVNSFHP